MTNPANGIHAINLIVYKIAESLQASGYPEPTIWRSSPITTVANNFDKLYFPSDSLSRSAEGSSEAIAKIHPLPQRR
ncbi:hypothetical protein [Scytonema sp. HK-05]|uniref:hypothetical protein n=1 Tax=Scytonema sp. HK-05 TaxID=1137095 RepID=UPI001E3CA91F|nr:hypothetical protein [Scytonema sp. HK-05]